MPASEYDRWRRWEHQFGPLGPERADAHAAAIAWHTYRSAHGKRFRKRLSDLLIRWGGRSRGEQDEPAGHPDPGDGDSGDLPGTTGAATAAGAAASDDDDPDPG